MGNMFNCHCSYVFLHVLVASLIVTRIVHFLCTCMKLSRERHSCAKIAKGIAEKTNLVWEPLKDLKHLNLQVLKMSWFEEEDKVTNYIRLVMERAVGLKRIELRGEGCKKCDAIDPRTSQVDETRRHRIKELLTNGSSSSSSTEKPPDVLKSPEHSPELTNDVKANGTANKEVPLANGVPEEAVSGMPATTSTEAVPVKAPTRTKVDPVSNKDHGSSLTPQPIRAPPNSSKSTPTDTDKDVPLPSRSPRITSLSETSTS